VCSGSSEEGNHLHFDLTDIYQPRAGFIHDLDPRVKLVGALLIILTVVTLPQGAWFSFGLILLLVVLLSKVAGLGLLYTIRGAFIALPFALAAIPIPCMTPGPAVWVVPGLGWAVTVSGLLRFGTILLRTWLAVQAGVLLSATTPVPQMLWGLKSLGLPRLLVAVIGFMIRYVFVLGDEVLRMLRARAARSPHLPGQRRPGVLWQGQMAGTMVGSFFLRSLERSERVYAAMASRGYQGEVVLLQQPSMDRFDWAALALLAITLSAVMTLGIWR
jgi:cobalt/nickel transport system permease protein